MKCWTITNKQLQISLVEFHPIDKKELKITGCLTLPIGLIRYMHEVFNNLAKMYSKMKKIGFAKSTRIMFNIFFHQ